MVADALDAADPETQSFQSIVARLKRKQYTPTPALPGVCGYPMPNGILIALNYRCTVCAAIRVVPVQGVIGVHVDHEPVGCLRCNQFSTVFSSVDVMSV